MTATGIDPSLLCSTASFTTTAATSRRKFKIPAKSRSKVECRGKTITAFSSSTTAAIGDDSRCASYGRRGIIFGATIPFFLNLHDSLEGFRANAAEDGFLKEEIRKVLSKGKAPGVLRLVFHDAGTFEIDENADGGVLMPLLGRPCTSTTALGETSVANISLEDETSGGMNGSIVYELDRPENTDLKKPLKILVKAKAKVDMIQPVSWADMIAMAGAEAVSVCGGPSIPVQLGRIDSMVPDPEGKLPQESLDASGLKQCFQRKGFSTQELVALSGAHTLGSKGFGNPTVFDNSYFKILLEKPWLSSAGMSSMVGLPSDRALVLDDECLRWISKYANNQNLFFEDFKNVYIKLVNTGARWKTPL